MENKSRRFEALDSLRGWAALAVAVFHFSPKWGGYLAVDFFLVLSGFILSHSYLYKYEKISPVEFISHRIARLYPLHIFTLFTFIFATLCVKGFLPRYEDGTLFTLIQHLTLTQNIGFNPRGMTFNYPSWSISVEFWVNIIFILFISKATKSSNLFIISVVGLLVIYGNTGHLDIHSENYFTFLNSGLIRGFSSFLLGIISYRIYLYYQNDKRVTKYINYIEWLCVMGVLVIVFGRSRMFSGTDMFAPFVFMFVVAVFTFESGYLSNHLKKYRYLGEISYSIYLNQITVLLLVRHVSHIFEIPRVFELSIYMALLVLYSHLTYLYIEKPLRRKGRNIISRIIIASPEK